MGCCGSSEAVEFTEILDRCQAPGLVFSEELIDVRGDGSKRNTVSWVPESGTMKALVVIAHGVNEHSLRYYRIAIPLVERGFGVFAIDHVSHGKSDGKKGVIQNGTYLYEDFSTFAALIQKKHPGLPLFVLGHSMGGAIAIMSINRIERVQAAVFSGAAIFGGPAAASPFGFRCLYPLTNTSFGACLSSITANLDPAGPLAPLEQTALTSDTDELETIKKDPRMGPQYITNRTGREVLKMIWLVKEEVPKITIPFLAIHGAEDQVVLPKSSEYLFRYSSTDITQRELHICPNTKHEPFNEIAPQGPEAILFVVNYLEKQYNRVTAEADNSSSLGLTTTTSIGDVNEVVGDDNVAEIEQGHATKPLATVPTTDTDAANARDSDVVREDDVELESGTKSDGNGTGYEKVKLLQ